MDANAIFDAFGEYAKKEMTRWKREQKMTQIRSVESRRCGNCDHWMKSSCKPEKEHGQFKSMNSPGCGDFIIDYGSKQLIDKFKDELERMKT